MSTHRHTHTHIPFSPWLPVARAVPTPWDGWGARVGMGRVGARVGMGWVGARVGMGLGLGQVINKEDILFGSQ